MQILLRVTASAGAQKMDKLGSIIERIVSAMWKRFFKHAEEY